MSQNTFKIEYAPTGRASCKDSKCKDKIDKDSLRIVKFSPKPERFGGDGSDVMSSNYHWKCFFATQKRMRAGSRKVEATSDLDGWDDIKGADQTKVEALIKGGDAGEDDDDSEADEKKAKKKKPAKKKAAPKRKKKDDDEGGDEDDEEEAPKKKKAKKEEKKEKPAKKKKASKKKKGSDDEDEGGDDEEEKTPKKKKAGGGGVGGIGVTRRFEADSKFWEVTRDSEETFTVRWGKLDSNGQSKEQKFADAAKCQKKYDSLVREKTGKGYTEM